MGKTVPSQSRPMAENAVSMRVCAPLPWITFGRVLYCIDHEYLTFLFVVDFYGSFTGKKSPTFNGKESQEHE